MKKNLLLVGGIFQVLIVLLHVGMFFGVSSASGLAEYTKQSLIIFNATVLTAVAFAAYVSLFHRHEMLGTTIGRVICWFIAILYIQRGIVGIFLRGFDWVDLGFAVVLGVLYIGAALPEKQKVAS